MQVTAPRLQNINRRRRWTDIEQARQLPVPRISPRLEDLERHWQEVRVNSGGVPSNFDIPYRSSNQPASHDLLQRSKRRSSPIYDRIQNRRLSTRGSTLASSFGRSQTDHQILLYTRPRPAPIFRSKTNHDSISHLPQIRRAFTRNSNDNYHHIITHSNVVPPTPPPPPPPPPPASHMQETLYQAPPQEKLFYFNRAYGRPPSPGSRPIQQQDLLSFRTSDHVPHTSRTDFGKNSEVFHHDRKSHQQHHRQQQQKKLYEVPEPLRRKNEVIRSINVPLSTTTDTRVDQHNLQRNTERRRPSAIIGSEGAAGGDAPHLEIAGSGGTSRVSVIQPRHVTLRPNPQGTSQSKCLPPNKENRTYIPPTADVIHNHIISNHKNANIYLNSHRGQARANVFSFPDVYPGNPEYGQGIHYLA